MPSSRSIIRRCVPACLCWSLLCQLLNAGLLATHDNWEPIGDVTLSVNQSDTHTADGIGDGGLYVNGQSNNPSQGCSYTLYGRAQDGDELQLSAAVSNINVSFVSVALQLYDLNTATVIAQSPASTLLANTEATIDLTTTLDSSHADHQIAVRLIRTDDGNTARNFLIDYVTLNDWYFPGTSAFRHLPDLPEQTLDTNLQTELDTIQARLKSDELGTFSPSNTTVQNAIATFDSHSITADTHWVDGPALNFHEVSFLRTFVQHLKNNPNDTEVIEKANLTVQLVAQNYLMGAIVHDTNMYDYRHFVRAACYLDANLQTTPRNLLCHVIAQHHIITKELWRADTNTLAADGWLNTDKMYNGSDTLLYFGLTHSETPEQRQRWASGFQRYINRYYSYSPGTAGGIKPDGSGYHHWNDYLRYMYSNRTAAAILYHLRDTQYQIDSEAYKRMRDHITGMLIKTSNDAVLLSQAGRTPFDQSLPINSKALRQAAIAGGAALGLDTPDPSTRQHPQQLLRNPRRPRHHWPLGFFRHLRHQLLHRHHRPWQWMDRRHARHGTMPLGS